MEVLTICNCERCEYSRFEWDGPDKSTVWKKLEEIRIALKKVKGEEVC